MKYTKLPILVAAFATSLNLSAVAADTGVHLPSVAPGSSGTSSPGEVSSHSLDVAGSSTTAYDGIVMSGGKVYFVKNGQPQKVNNTVRLSEGITAEPNGRVTLPDNRQVNLSNGQMVTLQGQVKSAPSGINFDSSRSDSSSQGTSSDNTGNSGNSSTGQGQGASPGTDNQSPAGK